MLIQLLAILRKQFILLRAEESRQMKGIKYGSAPNTDNFSQ